MTNYVNMASSAADLFNQNVPSGPLGGIMIATLFTVWSTRLVLYWFINSSQVQLPAYITADVIFYLESLHLFNQDFLDNLSLHALSPFTPAAMDILRAELAAGDALLLDAHLDIIVGELPISLEQLIAQVNLLYI